MLQPQRDVEETRKRPIHGSHEQRSGFTVQGINLEIVPKSEMLDHYTHQRKEGKDIKREKRMMI